MEVTVVRETGRRMNKDEKKVGATEAGERGHVEAVVSVCPRLLLTRFPLPPGQAVSQGPEHPIPLPPGCGPGTAASGQHCSVAPGLVMGQDSVAPPQLASLWRAGRRSPEICCSSSSVSSSSLLF